MMSVVKATRTDKGVQVHVSLRYRRPTISELVTEGEAWGLFKELSKLFEKGKPK